MAKFFVIGDVSVDQMYFVSDLPELGGEASAERAMMEPGGGRRHHRCSFSKAWQ